MDRKNTDRRVRYTKNALKEALLKLMRRKNLKKITTSELCREADISRNTFYSHYRDPIELFDHILHDFEEQIRTTLYASVQLNDEYGTVLAACRLVQDEPLMGKLILDNITNNKFLSVVLEEIRPTAYQNYREYGITDEHVLGMAFDFVTYGALYAIKDWFDAGCKEEPEIIAHDISDASQAVIETLKKEKHVSIY